MERLTSEERHSGPRGSWNFLQPYPSLLPFSPSLPELRRDKYSQLQESRGLSLSFSLPTLTHPLG